MCGVWGITGPGIQQKDLEMFKQMGIVSGVRGLHSAGIYQTRTIGSAKQWSHLDDYYKTTGPFTELLDCIEADRKYYPHLLSAISIDVLMGHVRHATKGEVSIKNAHPFETDKYIGMHNGTLIDAKYQHKTKTDSEMMFLDMDARGPEAVLGGMDTNSAYVVTMFDKTTKTLLFASNGRRPLWFVTLKDRSVTYWASEWGILQFVLNRNGVNYHKPDAIIPHTLFRLTPHRVTLTEKFQAFTVVKNLPEWHRLKAEEKAAEEAKKAKAETKVIDVASDAERANNQNFVQPEVRSSNVIPLKTNKEKQPVEFKRTESPLKLYRLKCDCGKQSLSIMQSNLCRRGVPGLPKFKALTNTFECSESCKPSPAELVKA